MVAQEPLLTLPDSVERLQRRSTEDLEALYLDDVFRYVSAFVRPPEEAEDVTMAVFHAALASPGGLRRAHDPRLWLLGIARRKAADSLRRRYRRLRSEAGVRSGALEMDIDRSLVLGEILAGLPAQHGQILVLKYVNELTIEEIANVLGKSTAATNSLLQRARESFHRQGAPHFLHQEGPR